MTPLLEAQRLSVAYGKVEALHDVSLRVPAGAIVTVIGAVVQFGAAYMPLGTTLSVTVKGQQGGVLSTATSSGLTGTVASSTASATIAVPTNQPAVITASATFTVLALRGTGPIYADGEPVEQIRVTIRLSGTLRPEQLDPAQKDALLEAFRDWKGRS